MCGKAYGAPLGSTSTSGPNATEYHSVINGGKYYTQAEFSNLASSKLGFGRGARSARHWPAIRTLAERPDILHPSRQRGGRG